MGTTSLFQRQARVTGSFLTKTLIWSQLKHFWKILLNLRTFLINHIHLKLWFQMFLKEMFLLRYRFWEVLRFKFERNFKNLFSDKLMSCNLKIIFTSPVRVKSFFTFKDKWPKMLLSWIVYKYKCSGCNATYYGKTKRHFKVWICEHLGI